MSNKKNNVIRFVVGSKNDIRSSVWRLWSNGNDLYLAARSFAHISKFSFHQSGLNRYAINANIKRDNSGNDRAVYKWKRLPESISGWTQCFGILVPPRITRKPFANDFNVEGKIIFIKPPSLEKKVIFNILLSRERVSTDYILRSTNRGAIIHGCIEMPREFV